MQSLSPFWLWDSPDFDSLQASEYQDAVLKVIALADVLLLVTSREKYADQSLWQLLEWLAPLDKPLLVCLNKINAQEEAALKSSFLKRYEQQLGNSNPPGIICIEHIRGLDHRASQLPTELGERIREQIEILAQASQQQDRRRITWQYIIRNFETWTQPLTAELQAQRQWQAVIDSTLDGAMDQYQRDYLDHPQHYDSFNRALAELLTLLEIPGVAAPLSKARKVITWPARKLIDIGRSYFSAGTSQAQAGFSDEHNPELSVLSLICANSISSLQQQARRHSEQQAHLQTWWLDLAEILQQQQTRLQSDYEHKAVAYQQDFQQQIELAAQSMYDNLQQQPATLNGLRAARVTADAAGVALALKTGGIGVNDLILAPAMLSLTNMLTEGALGKYIDRVKAKLRIKQAQTVKQQIMQNHFFGELTKLCAQLNPDRHLQISERELSRAQQELKINRAE